MKIAYQVPVDYDIDDPHFSQVMARIRKVIGEVKRPDTQFDMYPAVKGLRDIDLLANLSDRFNNDDVIFENMKTVVAGGMDGLVSACFFDSALWPARQKLDIPVVGLAESSLALAKFVGRRIGVMTIGQRHVPILEDMIRSYGFQDSVISAAPVRAIPTTENEAVGWFLEGRIERLMEVVEPVAQSFIRDGADVLIISCGLVSVLVGEAAGVREIDGVPLILPLAAATKTIETLVDLKAAGQPVKTTRGLWGRR
jgi:allantoin racemase